jgi:predicted DCC family thiol-disulfide oxidoreductase YuxK
MEEELSIVLFDGNCMLCNRFVRFVLKRDKGIYLFVSSYSKKGEALCVQYNIPQRTTLESVYLIQGNRVVKKSTAALNILSNCGLFFKVMAAILLFIPLRVRDYCYNIIATHRHRIFKNTCEVMSPNELKRVVL